MLRMRLDKPKHNATRFSQRRLFRICCGAGNPACRPAFSRPLRAVDEGQYPEEAAFPGGFSLRSRLSVPRRGRLKAGLQPGLAAPRYKPNASIELKHVPH